MTDSRGNRWSSIWDKKGVLDTLLRLVKEKKSVGQAVHIMNKDGHDVNRNMLIGKITRMRAAGRIDYGFDSGTFGSGSLKKRAKAAKTKARIAREKRTGKKFVPNYSASAPKAEKWESTFKELDMYKENQLRTIVDQPEDGCCWPISQNEEGQHLFCPRKKAASGNYCSFHSLASTQNGISRAEEYRVEKDRPKLEGDRAGRDLHRSGVTT